MAISKDLKKKLIEQYVADLSTATNAVIVQQSGVSVVTASAVRKDVKIVQGKYVVVRKRLFLRALKEAWLPEVEMNDLPGSIILITADNETDAFGPMKAVNKALKELKEKDENKGSYMFLWWWFEKIWKDGWYVNELANLPSKEELISKLLFMLKYPMQWLASVIDQIAKKNGEGVITKETKIEPKVETTPIAATEEAQAPEVEVAGEVASEETVAPESLPASGVATETPPETTPEEISS